MLRFAAGNFYINDKPTGAVVGQQPFGGSQSQRHERQGRFHDECAALGERPDDQGNLRSSCRLSVSLHESGLSSVTLTEFGMDWQWPPRSNSKNLPAEFAASLASGQEGWTRHQEKYREASLMERTGWWFKIKRKYF